MKVYLLTIESQDNVENLIYKSQESALECVKGDLLDRYHFDTDEPYITQEELEEKQDEAVNALQNYGSWKDDEVQYWLDKKDLLD